MQELLGSLRYAVRQFRRSPVFTTAAVLTLALGIGGTTAIFTLINAVMMRSLPVKDPGMLYRIGDGNDCCVEGGPQDRWGFYSFPLYERLKAQSPEFEEVMAFQAGNWQQPVRREGEPAARPLRSEYVTGNYFSALGVGAFGGRVFTADDDKPGEGQRIRLVKTTLEGDLEQVSLTPPEVLDALYPGMTLLFDDGYIIAKVVETKSDGVLIEIQNSGTLKSQKSVSVPNSDMNLPAMTPQDESDIAFACKNDVDWIAASFIRSADHVFEIQKLLAAEGKSDILVIAKIENSLGVQNFDAILQVADGIMVARGDLGVELPLEEVPRLQKMMIRKCCQVAKPVVTATQMLESMIKNPRPTRAEVSDVANAIYDSSSCVMLSGETAMGHYPVATVQMMKRIIREAEQDFSYRAFYGCTADPGSSDVSTSVAGAAVQTAYSADAKAIFVFTNSGATARLISRFRPQMPILALTPSEKAYHQMALYWGVVPFKTEELPTVQEATATLSQLALHDQLIQYGDLVVITTGSPFWIKGTTNTMMVESIGDVVVRAKKGVGKQIHGKILIFHAPQRHTIEEVRGKIVVLSHCDATYLPLLNHALGIVLQNHPEDKASEKEALKVAKTLDIPIVVRADGALSALRDGQVVTLDPEKKVVYKGSVKC